MTLSEAQLRRVRYLVDDEWVCDTDSRDDEHRTWEQFHSALDPMGPEELFQFASNFNCDCGVEELRRVVRHPRCDRGTALAIFWRLGPGWYYQHANADEVPQYERDVYHLLREIEAKYVAGGFEACEIAIDPRDLDGRDATQEYEDKGGVARVAPQMLQPSPGRRVQVLRL